MTWIRGRPDWMPGLEMLQLDPAGAVEALDGPQPGYADVYCWAWEDEPAGRVRSLFFVAGLGITEDPATGAAAVALGAQVRRPITIRQGPRLDPPRPPWTRRHGRSGRPRRPR